MGHPSSVQWRLMWIAVVCLVLSWPDDTGSLAIKALNWAADPTQSLPAEPRPIPLGLGDNAEAIQAHDAEEAEYYRLYDSSQLGRLRLWLRGLRDPLDVSTERQLVVGFAIFAALGIWRLEARTRR